MRLIERLRAIGQLWRDWPPLKQDFANCKWGAYPWDTEKGSLSIGADANDGELVQYLQSVLNTVWPLLPLKVDGVYGPKTMAAVAALQSRYAIYDKGAVDEETWDLIDWLAFDSYFKVRGKNKYTGLPVNERGLTKESAFVECYVRANFSELKLNRNVMVDRTMRGSTTTLSEHAKGNALDFTKITKEQGDAIAEWLVERAARWNLQQVIWYSRIAEPDGGRSKATTAVLWVWRKLSPRSLQHRDHVHVTSSSGTLWPIVNP